MKKIFLICRLIEIAILVFDRDDKIEVGKIFE